MHTLHVPDCLDALDFGAHFCSIILHCLFGRDVSPFKGTMPRRDALEQ